MYERTNKQHWLRNNLQYFIDEMSREKSEAMNNYIHWNVNIYKKKTHRKLWNNNSIQIREKKSKIKKKIFYSTIIFSNFNNSRFSLNRFNWTTMYPKKYEYYPKKLQNILRVWAKKNQKIWSRNNLQYFIDKTLKLVEKNQSWRITCST
jgi:hypothetical protein